jgi:thimet oligopeptidase
MKTLVRTPYSTQDFDWVRWTPKDIKRVAGEIVAFKKARYEEIRAIPKSDRTFENTIYALEASDDSISDQLSRIGLLKATSPKKEVRDAANTVSDTLTKQFVDIEFDPRMYQAVKEYAAKREKLTGPEKILFDDMRKSYARMGLDLPLAKRMKLKAALTRLGKLGTAFDRNLAEYKDCIKVTRAELDGLPETYIQNLKRDKQGRYLVTLAYPDIFPYLAGAHDEKRRKELQEKFNRRGGAQNLKLIEEMFRIRAANAKLLGYKSHFDLQTELRMAKSAKNVKLFLDDLEKRTRAPGARDFATLLTYKRARTNDPRAKLATHDIAYLFKQLRKEKFAIDGDTVKEYFPFAHVKQATLEAYSTLLGVSFKRISMKLWHEEVELYEIRDSKDKSLLAYFALDLYPREGKYGHAAAFEVTFGRQEGDRYATPLAAMVTNFPKPSKTNPSLMSHGEVETFFHEFGHVMHFTLTKARYRAQAGFNTAMDFVEAPSQMLENWVWDKDMLRKLSKHYKTGKALPSDLVDRMIGARLFGEAWATRGQIVLAKLDLLLHTKKVAKPNALYAKLEQELLGLTPPKSQRYLAGFAHLAHGYDAGYYGYLWSRVFAEDMFTRFEKEGVLNPKTGRDYRRTILEKGSSVDEMELVEEFLGRKSNNKAFLKSIGAS